MDFFEKQDQAFGKSRAFFTTFGAAVFLAVILLYFVLTICLSFFSPIIFGRQPVNSFERPGISADIKRNLPTAIYGRPPKIIAIRPMLIVGSFILVVILAASIRKTRAIKDGGGAYIAELMGGTLVEHPQTPQERLFANVVEEMAIAAGLPTPRIYILKHEYGINAITAGLDHDDAVIAVTQGALDHLNRDELQGVMAHEFGHILNGDCALNLTMAGWLYGLLLFSIAGKEVLGLTGRALVRANIFEVRALILSVPVVISGLLLLAGGYFGKLAASLVQAAFSRQREYLADAFGAQFTRNPKGLASALKKIAGLRTHGFVSKGSSLLMQSFFIASPVKIQGLLHTHPPIAERIYALDPSWDGEIESIELILPELPNYGPNRSGGIDNLKRNPSHVLKESISGRGNLMEKAGQLPETWASALIGGMLLAGGRTASADTSQVLETAAKLYRAIPEPLRNAAHDPALAGPLVAAMFLNDGEELLNRQTSIINNYLGEGSGHMALKLRADLEDNFRLPLLGMASPTMQNYSREHKVRLAQAVKELITSDGKLELFEVAAWQIVKKHLRSPGERKPADVVSFDGYVKRLQHSAVTVLSIMAYLGAKDDEEAQAAFQAGWKPMNAIWPALPMLPKDRAGSKDLALALESLEGASDKIKNLLILAAIGTALHDQQINQKEYELLRALAASLDVPLPALNITDQMQA